MLRRIAYTAVTYLMSPIYAIYWFLRGIGNRAYRDRFGQRFGIGYPLLPDGCIWIHAVSVGEVQAAVPLIRTLARQFPERKLLITTVTPTGAARVRAVFGDTVAHSYLPFEIPNAIRNFFEATRPIIALILETEIWPNLYHACGKRKIPLILVSARISPKSVARYRRLLPLFSETLSYGIVIAAQSEGDARRFRDLGASAERTRVTGNIKFDFETSDGLPDKGREFRRRYLGDRPAWIAASTHDKEEDMVLAAHRKVLAAQPDAVLILVPRHPERFNAVESLLRKQGLGFVTRTSGDSCTAEHSIFLGNTMGEVPLFYAASDIAFVGGTLVPVGGHNLLEPASLGRPVITGPHLFNTQDIADKFSERDACIVVQSEAELARAVIDLFDNPSKAERMGREGEQIIEKNRGALQRLLQLLDPLIHAVINPSGSASAR
ncbi:MAG: lipid IV(A) 3-deoxy-D-manno-octulosonic acid transferase [Gammaproteobacteria bacterium]|nr:lipid IV(A) 3-deoxy-D-manno-octulosonic acid transferase [Gammaproteobacteria bacterium]